MLARCALRLLPRPLFRFSTKDKLAAILQKIDVSLENGKTAPLPESGLIAGQHIDEGSSKVTISLNLSKDYRKIKAVLKSELEVGGFRDVDILLAPKPKEEKFNRKGNLLGIKKIIAVSSCKGGVGKSTIAVNVAATLHAQGFRVGIFDSDIYGPSLPTLLNREGETLRPHPANEKEIEPVDYEGIKCMSFGFVGQKPAIMRGPIVSSIISQLIYQTHWGELDYLVVDMPPGTGDIQLSLCQELKLDGAVIVTTPQRLSFIDVIKGIEMFQDLRVRILGIVENMAYYECGKCGTQDLIFGRGYTQMMMTQFGIEVTPPLPRTPSRYPSSARSPSTPTTELHSRWCCPPSTPCPRSTPPSARTSSRSWRRRTRGCSCSTTLRNGRSWWRSTARRSSSVPTRCASTASAPPALTNSAEPCSSGRRRSTPRSTPPRSRRRATTQSLSSGPTATRAASTPTSASPPRKYPQSDLVTTDSITVSQTPHYHGHHQYHSHPRWRQLATWRTGGGITVGVAHIFDTPI